MLRLSIAAAFAVLAAGCPADDDYPPVPPGGGPPGGNTGGDAGVDASDGGTGALRSKICVLLDLRQPTNCSTNNNVGVVVRELGTQNQATSVANGFFDLAPAARDVAILEVGAGSAALVPSIVAIDVDDPPDTVPVPAAAQYTALATRLGVVTPDGSGDIAAYFLDASERPLAGVTAQTPDGSEIAPYYDVSGADQWVQGVETGPYGGSLLFGVPAGTATVPAFSSDLQDVSIAGIRVVDGHVTFVTQRLTE